MVWIIWNDVDSVYFIESEYTLNGITKEET